MINSPIDALLEYLIKKDHYAAFMDSQKLLQIEAKRICDNLNSVGTNSVIVNRRSRVDLKGRNEHLMNIELIEQLEKEIEIQIEILAKKYSIVSHHKMQKKELEKFISDSELAKHPQLTSLISEFLTRMKELYHYSKVIEEGEWVKQNAANEKQTHDVLELSKEQYIQNQESNELGYSIGPEVWNDIEYDTGEKADLENLDLAEEITKDLNSNLDKKLQVELFNRIRRLGKSQRQGFLKSLHRLSSLRR